MTIKTKDLEQFEEDLRKINSEILKLHKKGLPFWDKWFSLGKHPICGTQLFYYLALYPEDRKKYVKACAETIKELGNHRRIRELKDGVSKVFAELIRENEAIGGAIGCGSAYFWKGLNLLVAETLRNLPVQDDSYIDAETGNLLEGAIIDWDAEKDMIHTVHKYRRLESLNERDFSVILPWLEGYKEREISDRTSIPKTTAHEIISRFKKSLEEE